MPARHSNSPPGLAVVGCGHWGANHLRVFAALPLDCRLTHVCDIDAARREWAGALYPRARAVANLDEVLAAPEVDAVVIATPAATHYELARECLAAGKDVLCEKPLALRPDECETLVDLADEQDRVLMVGHVYCFDAGIAALRDYVRGGSLGQLLYASSMRTNRGPIRDDVSVLYDLGCHDVAIFNHLLGGVPVDVVARGACFRQEPREDVVFLTLEYPGPVLVNVHLSWLAARKVRQITLVGEHGGVEWDELATDVSLRLTEDAGWRARSSGGNGRPLGPPRPRAVTLPPDAPEPLETQARHFLECLRTRRTPLCDGRHATEVIRTLWRAELALAQARSVQP